MRSFQTRDEVIKQPTQQQQQPIEEKERKKIILEATNRERLLITHEMQ